MPAESPSTRWLEYFESRQGRPLDAPLGLRREICVLLTAEVIALTYYRVLPQLRSPVGAPTPAPAVA